MRILDRDLMDRQRVHGAGQPAVALRVGLAIILVVEIVRISAANVNGAGDVVGTLWKQLGPSMPKPRASSTCRANSGSST